MEGLQLDLTAIAAIWMGGSLLLVPIAGVTARFALKPLLDSFVRLREARASAESTRELDLRFSILEQRLDRLSETIERWSATEPTGQEAAAAYR